MKNGNEDMEICEYDSMKMSGYEDMRIWGYDR
jgi:hypothetical protein